MWLVLTDRWTDIAPQAEIAEAERKGANEEFPVRVKSELMAATA